MTASIMFSLVTTFLIANLTIFLQNNNEGLLHNHSLRNLIYSVACADEIYTFSKFGNI